ncbi:MULTISPECIES: hypothetical protein [unclassified Streptomyces]|uniref:hypothetical protein n=1 Tax=unclassified Streptomyces TaxID=2593676 RepID=UPI001F2CC6D9|nr:hypothetical protein [Streptomyces sp. NRRL F-2747]
MRVHSAGWPPRRDHRDDVPGPAHRNARTHTDTPAIPNLTDDRGLTQVGKAEGTPTNFVITVTTPEVAGQHKIRIIIPDDYYTDPGKRYPEFHFQHGAGDGPATPTWPTPPCSPPKR